MPKVSAFLVSFLITVSLTPLVIKLYRSLGWLDRPDKKDDIKAKITHQQPVPRGGGLPIFAALLISSLIFLQPDKYLVAILVGAGLLTLIGWLDDIFNLSPILRMITGSAAALLVVGSGIGIAFITNPFGPGVIQLNQPQVALELFGQVKTIWILADLFAFVFILWNMNAVNWSKGVDGQLPAFVTLAFLFLGLLSTSFTGDPTQFSNTVLSFILAGSFLGLLIFNWPPQKIMPGYGAGSLAGFMLSILAILSGAKVATTLMVLAIPTADGIFAFLRRLRAGKSPFWGDRGHLHHKLLDWYGWNKAQIAIFYSLGTLVMGILSLYLETTGKIIALALSFWLVFMIQIWAKIKEIRQKGAKNE
ncbi:MAG: hypothetical protein GF381_03160 [Candidatus Pacebacteria bacterium]|nr:hypothetical protein [Candidatus Paceibacterota bacterium]